MRQSYGRRRPLLNRQRVQKSPQPACGRSRWCLLFNRTYVVDDVTEWAVCCLDIYHCVRHLFGALSFLDEYVNVLSSTAAYAAVMVRFVGLTSEASTARTSLDFAELWSSPGLFEMGLRASGEQMPRKRRYASC